MLETLLSLKKTSASENKHLCTTYSELLGVNVHEQYWCSVEDGSILQMTLCSGNVDRNKLQDSTILEDEVIQATYCAAFAEKMSELYSKQFEEMQRASLPP